MSQNWLAYLLLLVVETVERKVSAGKKIGVEDFKRMVYAGGPAIDVAESTARSVLIAAFREVGIQLVDPNHKTISMDNLRKVEGQ